jgi:hypothetical protein
VIAVPAWAEQVRSAEIIAGMAIRLAGLYGVPPAAPPGSEARDRSLFLALGVSKRLLADPPLDVVGRPREAPPTDRSDAQLDLRPAAMRLRLYTA